jgi:hypothetical protein
VLKEIEEIDLLIQNDEMMNKISFVRGTRVDADEEDDRSENAIKLPGEDDS